MQPEDLEGAVRLRASEVNRACRTYGLVLTDRERDLLTAPCPQNLLTGPDQQLRYVLWRSLEPVQCPVCGGVTCRRAAAVEWDEEGRDEHPDDGYQCPRCKAGLVWHLGALNPMQWFTPRPAPRDT
jgi:hypothetical protein